MNISKLFLATALVLISVRSLAYTDSADAFNQLQKKVQDTINENRKFYSCESDFGTPTYFYQGKIPTSWYLINVAGVATPLANMNLVNEISSISADGAHFQSVHTKDFNTQKADYLSHSVVRETETWTFVFSADIRTSRISYAHKQGWLGYYTFSAKGQCSILSKDQFFENLQKRIKQ